MAEKFKAAERAARKVTHAATKESQELLQLFGIPYVNSPGEAEAQCAFLNTSGLTMGTITENSDIFLFGGKVVYKNTFADNTFLPI